MKKFALILVIVSAFIFLSSLFLNSVIIFVAKKQLATVFEGSEARIGACRLNLKQLTLSEINIGKKNNYNFLVKEVKVEYSLPAIFKGEVGKVSLNDAKININLPQENIATFPKHLNVGSQKSPFLVKSVELSNVNLEVKTKDLNINGVLALEVRPIEQVVQYLDVKINSLDFVGVNLSDLSFKAEQGSSGNFGIKQAKYNKLKISDVKSEVQLNGTELALKNLDAKVLDGDITGSLKLKLEQDFGYSGTLNAAKLDIDRFVNDFDFKEKFEMTGKLSGDLVFEGKGADITVLNGKFSTLEPGGMLIIKDTKFLENMAHSTNQSLDLLVESFKNYHYNIGTITLSLEDRNMVLNAALEGETGKRNISIVLHK